MEFAKGVLKHRESDWGKFPISLMATGGMRQVSDEDRERVMRAVRDYLGNAANCPFLFLPEQARVISGEEVSPGGVGVVVDPLAAVAARAR